MSGNMSIRDFFQPCPKRAVMAQVQPQSTQLSTVRTAANAEEMQDFSDENPTKRQRIHDKGKGKATQIDFLQLKNELSTPSEFGTSMADHAIIGIESVSALQASASSIAINNSGESSADQNRRFMAHAVKHTADILGSPHNEEITDYKGLLLSLIKNNNIQKKNLVDFISSELYRYDNSLKPVMAWAEEDQEKRNNWATHCPLVQKIWMEFVDKIKDICYGEAAVVIENMSAPSGPLRSRCTFVWHYPTNNVSLPRFAHVLNPASETMKTQNWKIGPRDDVRTQNLVPVRMDYGFSTNDKRNKGINWNEKFQNWSEVKKACFTLQAKLCQNDRFIFTFGQHATEDFISCLREQGLLVHDLQLDVETKMFANKPRISLVLDDKSNVKMVIFPLFHGQFAFNNDRLLSGALWDLVFNAGCEIAGIKVIAPEVFTRRAEALAKAKATGNRRRQNDQNEVGRLYAEDFANDCIRSKEQLREQFPVVFQSNPGLQADMDRGIALGHPPIAYLEGIFDERSKATRKANTISKKGAAAAPARQSGPAKRAVVAHDPNNLGNRYIPVQKKYFAIRNTYQARNALDQRQTHSSMVIGLTLFRLDHAERLYDRWLNKTDGSQFSNWVSTWTTTASTETPWGLQYETPDLRYPNQDHPAVYISASGCNSAKKAHYLSEGYSRPKRAKKSDNEEAGDKSTEALAEE